jgi:hypothetical protein
MKFSGLRISSRVLNLVCRSLDKASPKRSTRGAKSSVPDARESIEGHQETPPLVACGTARVAAFLKFQLDSQAKMFLICTHPRKPIEGGRRLVVAHQTTT